MKALVTGASSGIGLALARLLSVQGYDLILTGRNGERLEQLARELGAGVQLITADLANPVERALVVRTIQQQKPDLVVNNAGLGLYGKSADLEITRQMELIEVNVVALQQLTLESVQTWKDAGKKGTVMNISSAAAFQVFPYFAVYSASKAFVNQFSQSVDAEMKEEGIRVLSSCPGMVRTNFRTRSGGKEEGSFMTAEFAALEIWKQIQCGQPLRTFNWKYRVLTFLTRYVFPKALVTAILKRQVRSFMK